MLSKTEKESVRWVRGTAHLREGEREKEGKRAKERVEERAVMR